MEIKKSYQADLERHRPLAFVLGLLLAVAALVVALEYTSSPFAEDSDEELLEDLAEDLEYMSAPEQREFETAPPVPEPPKTVAVIRPVDEPKIQAEPDRLMPETPPTTVGEGEPDETASTTPEIPPVAVDDNDEPLSMRVVERLPEFPGGMVEFMKWLTRNLKYPPQAKRAKMMGNVIVSFVVNKDGTTSDAKIVQSAGAAFDGEALRVIRMMPRWKPGEDHGKPCRTLFAIPIVFSL